MCGATKNKLSFLRCSILQKIRIKRNDKINVVIFTNIKKFSFSKILSAIVIIFIIILLTALISTRLFLQNNNSQINSRSYLNDETIVVGLKSILTNSKFIKEAPIGLPVKLKISGINLESNIIPVGLTADSHMDVPPNSVEVGWFNGRAKPGEQGNAVLDGHLMAGTAGGVFENLHKVEIGQSILVKDENGIEREFKVTNTKILDYNETSLNDIFGPTEKRGLVIITCHGDWLESAQTFNKRLVVFAELKL